MFRELSRKKSEIPLCDCIAILEKEKRGVLSVLGDGGYPYGMPMNHFYCREDNKIYFHCGKSGHRLDALKRCDKVSFCVYDEGEKCDNDWALNFKSVIVFGRVEIIDDMQRIIDITTKLSYKFTSDEDYIKREIEAFGKETLLLALTLEHICGKKIKES